MFDDPKKHLKWMEEALLEEEEEEEEEEEDAEELPDFPEEDWEKILEEDWDFTQPPESNPALNFSRALYEDEFLPDEDAFSDTHKGRAAKLIEKDQQKELRRKAKKEKTEKKRSKGIGGLVLLALLELLGIFMIIGWWILWLT